VLAAFTAVVRALFNEDNSVSATGRLGNVSGFAVSASTTC